MGPAEDRSNATLIDGRVRSDLLVGDSFRHALAAIQAVPSASFLPARSAGRTRPSGITATMRARAT